MEGIEMIDLPDLYMAEKGRHLLEMQAIEKFYAFCRDTERNGLWYIEDVEYGLNGLSVSNLCLSLRPVLGGRDYFFDAHKYKTPPTEASGVE